MRHVPLERDINIAVNGCSGFATSTQKGPFMAMLVSRSRGTYLIKTGKSAPLLFCLNFCYCAGQYHCNLFNYIPRLPHFMRLVLSSVNCRQAFIRFKCLVRRLIPAAWLLNMSFLPPPFALQASLATRIVKQPFCQSVNQCISQ